MNRSKSQRAGLLAHQLAHNWRTETANRLLMRDCAPRLGMYFI